ncbi:Hypothetical predicted protein [Pelobates cultripes]|uniref:Uncharacterized protein n=1 Tax=Pelobates cultripes TaxID=61616 RepID=A0AAD1QX88_PELCU|nr:Hypothetical predicted protein [Pelobates cultripes]
MNCAALAASLEKALARVLPQVASDRATTGVPFSAEDLEASDSSRNKQTCPQKRYWKGDTRNTVSTMP